MKVISTLRQAVVLRTGIAAILLLASLCLAPTAQAQFTLDFVYDSETDTTTATYTGSWATFSGSNYTDGPSRTLTTDGIDARNATYTLMASTALAGIVPWTNATVNGQTGDSWGFSSNYLFANYAYVAGTQLTGTLSFVGSNLTDLGFDATEIANGGVLGSGGYAVTWSASNAAVPEPATYTMLLGFVALGCAVYRARRRHQLG